MKINDILTLQSTAALAQTDTKKSTLELITKLAASQIKALESRQVLNTLINREKLGSTAVGHGVALPHGRINGIDKPIAVLITLAEPIDFDAPDDIKVDILFGLLIPEHANDQHLEILAALAEKLSKPEYREKLRTATNAKDLFLAATNEQ